MRLIRVISITVALLLSGWSAIASSLPHTRAQAVLDSIASHPALASSQVGMLAVTMSGDTLAVLNADRKFVPASNVKLISTGIALRTLGEDFRFTTSLGYSGEIIDGVLFGDLYIIGGGDPTTGSQSSCATPLASLFGRWHTILKDAGIKAIDGRIIGEPGLFGLPTAENLGWTYDDLGTYYGVGPTGLNFYENAHNFLVKPGQTPRSTPYISQSYPILPWMDIRVSATTGVARSANTLYYINTNLAPVGEFAGSFPLDRKAYTFEGSNRFGAYTCAFYFCTYLENHGLSVSGGYADVDDSGIIRSDLTKKGSERAPEVRNLVILGSTESPKLSAIITETNHESNNFFAETLLKMSANHLGYATDERGAAKAMEFALSSMGLETKYRCKLVDGSGLSRKNYVSPSFFVDFLRSMSGSEVYLRSLPSPGSKGTLEYKFPKESAEFRARIRLKSGSMDGVRCYSGYILSSDGDPSKTVLFSLMTNNADASSWVVNSLLDAIIRAVAVEN